VREISGRGPVGFSEKLCSVELIILPHIPEVLCSHKYFCENLASRKYDAAAVWFYSVTRYSFS